MFFSLKNDCRLGCVSLEFYLCGEAQTDHQDKDDNIYMFFFVSRIFHSFFNIVLVSTIYAEEARKRRPSGWFVNQSVGEENNVFLKNVCRLSLCLP